MKRNQGELTATVSRISWLYNADRYGFPWREVYSEALWHGQEVVVVAPVSGPRTQSGVSYETIDPTVEQLEAWAKVEPNLKVIRWPAISQADTDFGKMAQGAVEHATGRFLLLLGSDELVEMAPLLRWLSAWEKPLLEAPVAVEFERLDFCVSTKWNTPIHWPERNQFICQLAARKWFTPEGPLFFFGDAGEVAGSPLPPIKTGIPILHYHGLLSEALNRAKEWALQESYGGIETPDERIATGWQRFFGQDSPWQRRKKFDRQHPLVMWPWLSRAEMYLRGRNK